jgi:thioesterase domain-containing protein
VSTNPIYAELTQRLQQELYHDIPLVQALALNVVELEFGVVRFSAPLSPNRNDKGCAFGGSLASLLTLAAWSVLRVETWRRAWPADIFVHTSDLVYRAPVWQDFSICARCEPDALDAFARQFEATGKAALRLQAQAHANDTLCAEMQARFVALRP